MTIELVSGNYSVITRLTAGHYTISIADWIAQSSKKSAGKPSIMVYKKDSDFTERAWEEAIMQPDEIWNGEIHGSSENLLKIILWCLVHPV